MDMRTLQQADLTSLDSAADAYDGLCAAFGAQGDGWRSGVDDRVHNSGWTGSAADSAARSLALTTRKLRAAQLELELLGRILRGGADALLLARSRLHQALDAAEQARMSVDESGGVSPPPLPRSGLRDPDVVSLQAAAARLAQQVTAALAEADGADRATAERLRHCAARARSGAGLALDAVGIDRLDASLDPLGPLLAALPKADASPVAVRDWWGTLTPDEQQRLIRTHPELLGNRDGIPCAARDQANRLLLARLIDRHQQVPEPSPDDRERLAGLRAVQRRLDDSAGHLPPALLLGIGGDGQGRAVLSWGDPDTARNVCAYVPGLGTTLAVVAGGDADRALNVWRATVKADPAAPAASIVWLGYEPPPGLDRLAQGDVHPAEVLSTARAERGAADYDRFLGGLRATHEGPPAHLTALGHSYGSTTVGLAAQRPGGTGADDVVLVGSPGVGASSAAELGVGAGHVWVGDAENDPVSRLPSKGAAVSAAAGPVGERLYAAGSGGHRLYSGADPASQEFGAHRFRAADGPSYSFASHSDYLNDPEVAESRDSIDNIGQIVAGRYDHVTPQARR